MKEGDVSPQKTYLLKGGSLQELLRSIKRIVAGPGLAWKDLPGGERLLYLMPQSASVGSLCLTKDRPQYVPLPTSNPTAGSTRCYVTMGTVNDKLVSGWTDHYDLLEDTWFWVKVHFSASTDRLEVTYSEIVCGGSENAQTSGAWGAAGEFPPHFVVPIGYFGAAERAIQNFGSGSVSIGAAISAVNSEAGLRSVFQRQISYCRLAS